MAGFGGLRNDLHRQQASMRIGKDILFDMGNIVEIYRYHPIYEFEFIFLFNYVSILWKYLLAPPGLLITSHLELLPWLSRSRKIVFEV